MKKYLNKNIEIKIENLNNVEHLLNTYSLSQPITFKCIKCGKMEHLQIKALQKREKLICHKCLLQKNRKFFKQNFDIDSDRLKDIKIPISPTQVIKFKCSVCGKISTVQYRHYNGICEHCCRSIAGQNIWNREGYKEKWKKNFIKKYGIENPLMDKEKIKRKMNEKYGVDYAMQSEQLKNKQNETMIKKYGGFTLQNKNLRKKVDATVYKKYGAKNIRNSNYYKEKFELFKDKIYKNLKRMYLYNGIYFDSSWELSYYIWLSDNKIEFIYHPQQGIEYISNGKKHKYYPDFIVENNIIEIKGNQFFDKNGNYIIKNQLDADKWNCIQKNAIVYKFNDIKIYLKYVKDKYGKNYLKQFKIF